MAGKLSMPLKIGSNCAPQIISKASLSKTQILQPSLLHRKMSACCKRQTAQIVHTWGNVYEWMYLPGSVGIVS